MKTSQRLKPLVEHTLVHHAYCTTVPGIRCAKICMHTVCLYKFYMNECILYTRLCVHAPCAPSDRKTTHSNSIGVCKFLVHHASVYFFSYCVRVVFKVQPLSKFFCTLDTI